MCYKSIVLFLILKIFSYIFFISNNCLPHSYTSSITGTATPCRYFQEDFLYGLRYIHQEAHRQGVAVPVMDEVYEWGVKMINNNI